MALLAIQIQAKAALARACSPNAALPIPFQDKAIVRILQPELRLAAQKIATRQHILLAIAVKIAHRNAVNGRKLGFAGPGSRPLPRWRRTLLASVVACSSTGAWTT